MENKKSCFQLYFSPFNTFLISIMNVQIFLCRERGGVESVIQMLNKWLFYRVVLYDVTVDQTGGLPGRRATRSSLKCHEIHKSEEGELHNSM